MIIYQGPSSLTGAPIVAIATNIYQPSRNGKTGPMIQTWILSAEHSPTAAVKLGADAAVCGDCPLRAGACYVTLHQAPSSIFAKYQRNGYPPVPRSRLHMLATDRAVRLGAYGDPAAVPTPIWRNLLKPTRTHTAYTHQWRHAATLRNTAMASVDSPTERDQARALGWRTFRVRHKGAPLLPGEISCPASAESGHRTTCDRCGLCQGARIDAPDISIEVHGSRAGRFPTAEDK